MHLAVLNSKVLRNHEGEEFWLNRPIDNLSQRDIRFTILNYDWTELDLADLTSAAVSHLKGGFYSGVVHGDIHGRNILIVDRLPVFIDFALSGPGHPLVDLIRLDAVVRSATLRMLLDKRSMHEVFYSLYIEGVSSEEILRRYPIIDASPLAALAIRTSAKIRSVSLEVAEAHGLGVTHYLAMQCVVAAHVLANRNLGSGIERLDGERGWICTA